MALLSCVFEQTTLYPWFAIYAVACIDLAIYGAYFVDKDGHRQRASTKRKFFRGGQLYTALVMLTHILGGFIEWGFGSVALLGWCMGYGESISLSGVGHYSTSFLGDIQQFQLDYSLRPMYEGWILPYCSLNTAAAISLLFAMVFSAPSGALLTPNVWGLKYVTQPGYAGVNLLRFIFAFKAFLLLPMASSGIVGSSRSMGMFFFQQFYLYLSPMMAWVADSFLGEIILYPCRFAGVAASMNETDFRFAFQQSWIILHMSQIVRLTSRFVLPTTSQGGERGNLLNEPIFYSISVSTAVLVIIPFVFPPWANFMVLGLTAFSLWIRPSVIIKPAIVKR